MDFTVYTVHALLTRKSSHHDLSHLKSGMHIDYSLKKLFSLKNHLANFTPLTLTFHGPSLIPTDSLSQMNSAHQEMYEIFNTSKLFIIL
jgi:hypothetical protein